MGSLSVSTYVIMSQADFREKAVNKAAAISQVGICGKLECEHSCHMSQADVREKAVNKAAAISQVGICGKLEYGHSYVTG